MELFVFSRFYYFSSPFTPSTSPMNWFILLCVVFVIAVPDVRGQEYIKICVDIWGCCVTQEGTSCIASNDIALNWDGEYFYTSSGYQFPLIVANSNGQIASGYFSCDLDHLGSLGGWQGDYITVTSYGPGFYLCSNKHGCCWGNPCFTGGCQLSFNSETITLLDQFNSFATGPKVPHNDTTSWTFWNIPNWGELTVNVQIFEVQK